MDGQMVWQASYILQHPLVPSESKGMTRYPLTLKGQHDSLNVVSCGFVLLIFFATSYFSK